MARSLIALVIAATLLGGCSRFKAVNKRLSNFSAYYNTFYNAELALDECVTGFDLSVEDSPVDQNVFVSLFGRSEAGTTQRKPCEDAILKSADVLRDHPDSKWVDDATLLIGKSWFFTLNFVGAEQKFKEILVLDSPLEYEARFWLARTYIASGAYDEAYEHLQATLGGEDLPRRWEPQYRLALAELHVTREDWEEAVLELEAGIPDVRDSDLASRAQLLLGQVYEVLERYEDAVQAYDAVLRYKPWYELSYAAQYSAIRVLVSHGDADLALVRLRKMERDDKNYDYRAYLSYMRGRTYQARGENERALDHYYYLLYDENGREPTVKGHVHYALALYYRDVERDFLYASAHFDTAKTSLGNSAVTSRRPGGAGRSTRQSSSNTSGQRAPGAITDAEEQSRVFGGFSDVMDRIHLMDSLLYLGNMPDTVFDAWVLEQRRELAKELEEQMKAEERRMAEEGFRGGGNMDFNQGFGVLPQGKDVGQADMGFLFHRDEIQMQQAFNSFKSVWGDRPLARNWRRIAAVMAAASETREGEEVAFRSRDEPGEALPRFDVSAVPRDSLSREAMLGDRAWAWYELGNVLFLSMNMPDSAAFWYREVIEVAGVLPVAQRAYYALAEVQRALLDTLSADRLYREIMERFPETDLAAQAATRLGMDPAETVTADTLVLAEAQYAENHSAWQDGAYARALQGMVSTAQQYPTTIVAPRALYAAGNIYLSWARRDSLNLFGPLPVTDSSAAWLRRTRTPPMADTARVQLKHVMEVLRFGYPNSGQARPASGLILALDERWAAIMAPLDSLARLDSLATADSLALIDSLAVVSLVDSLIVSDSLSLPADDSLLTAVRDSLYYAVSDSLTREEEAARMAALAEAAKTVEGPVKTVQDAAPGQLQQLRPPSAGQPPNPRLQEPVAGARGDPRMRALGQRDPSLGNIDWSKGGYTIVVQRMPSHQAATAFATNFGRTLSFPVDVFSAAVERGQEFRVGVGLFDTITQAQQAMQQLQGQLPENSEIVHIPRPSRF